MLLPDHLRSRLPPHHSQEAEDEPWIYAAYRLRGTNLAWYVMEGEPDGEDYVFFGFVAGLENEFAEFRLSDLKAMTSQLGGRVKLDPAFTEGRLTDVVPAPDS